MDISRDIIIDLLPLYIAGDASKDTISLGILTFLGFAGLVFFMFVSSP